MAELRATGFVPKISVTSLGGGGAAGKFIPAIMYPLASKELASMSPTRASSGVGSPTKICHISGPAYRYALPATLLALVPVMTMGTFTITLKFPVRVLLGKSNCKITLALTAVNVRSITVVAK